ncbi:MAG: DUF2062 domain-containing protein [Rhodocyclaceae bacterium]
MTRRHAINICTMRKTFKRYLPEPETLRENRWFSMLGDTLFHPSLWHLNRRSAAGGVATGLFCGLIPGPLQVLGSVIACVIFRVNLPVAVVTTFYTNPFTIVPLYVAAFWIGSALLGSTGRFVYPPDMGDMSLVEWGQALLHWLGGLGAPLALGLVVLATMLALIGYFAVWLLWRWHLVREYRRRKARRLPPAPV